ncbi:MAG: hypothetical protein F6J98_48195 [Moorea sp. SIO4G2]|nr:hypothetical protein [Moorena sp. SIO4G2]
MIIFDTIFPTPCSLLPAPCSLLPTPCSLFPIPFAIIFCNNLHRLVKA